MSGYRHCVTEEAAQRQRQFEQALLELMGVKPLEQIAIKEICDKVGLSRKSFYRYFSNREDCLCALVDHTIQGQTNWPLDLTHMRKKLEEYFLYWKEQRLLLESLVRNDLGNLLFERGMACAAQEFGIREHLDKQEETIFFISGLTGVLLNWHREGYRKTPEELAAILTDFLPFYSTRGVF